MCCLADTARGEDAGDEDADIKQPQSDLSSHFLKRVQIEGNRIESTLGTKPEILGSFFNFCILTHWHRLTALGFLAVPLKFDSLPL
jgi:hypothetical protein